MSAKTLTSKIMLKALASMDPMLRQKLTLIMGGGGAMILAHGYPLATTDIDALPKGLEFYELSPLVEKISQELGIPGDWLNPHFSTFTYVLPPSYSQRLIEVYRGLNLDVQALGAEDMLIMKCCAHRQKDIGHARALIKKGADIRFVEDHLQQLLDRKIPVAGSALEFLDELIGE